MSDKKDSFLDAMLYDGYGYGLSGVIFYFLRFLILFAACSFCLYMLMALIYPWEDGGAACVIYALGIGPLYYGPINAVACLLLFVTRLCPQMFTKYWAVLIEAPVYLVLAAVISFFDHSSYDAAPLIPLAVICPVCVVANLLIKRRNARRIQ